MPLDSESRRQLQISTERHKIAIAIRERGTLVQAIDVIPGTPVMALWEHGRDSNGMERAVFLSQDAKLLYVEAYEHSGHAWALEDQDLAYEALQLAEDDKSAPTTSRPMPLLQQLRPSVN